MVDTLVKEGKITDREVERAFHRVKRHMFLEGIVPPTEAYQDRAIMLKGNISSSSQPQVIAMMLEALDLEYGLKILEVGTASGYNVALIAEIVGRDNQVYTIELEADLAERAARILKDVGYPGITVIAGDGRRGYPIAAPYDRIILTAKAQSIYPELLRQLSSDGMMLLPFDFFGVLTVPVKLYSLGKGKYRGPLVGFPVHFVPIRGVDLQEKTDNRLMGYYTRFANYLTKNYNELSQEQLVGLMLLLTVYYKEDKLENNNDFYLDVLEHWEDAGKPGLTDYEFAYDTAVKDWQLIPVF